MSCQLGEGERRLLTDRQQPDHRPLVLGQAVPAIANGAGVGQRAVKPADMTEAIGAGERHAPRSGNARQLFRGAGVQATE